MNHTFLCPFCFKEIRENEVLFRSDKVTFSVPDTPSMRKETVSIPIETVHITDQDLQAEADALLPTGYFDWEMFEYTFPDGPEKEEILRKKQEILSKMGQSTPNDKFGTAKAEKPFPDPHFFDALEPPDKFHTGDPVYDEFWKMYDGTTENNPSDEVLHGRSYLRKLLDPRNPEHQKYLVRQRAGDRYGPEYAEDFLIRDGDGMIKALELPDKASRYCDVRVCPHCHNPLPDNYGKYDARFIVVIGITGSGKTVYLSQLLKNMRSYATKAGLTAMVTSRSVRQFGDKNVVAFNSPLPVGTNPKEFQQPLFYELTHAAQDGSRRRITDTLVMYDVAGEVFKDRDLISHFAECIRYADGLMLLIDPEQLDAVKRAENSDRDLVEPTRVLEESYNIIMNGQPGAKQCATPVAVCISKMDTMQWLFDQEDPDLMPLLTEDVHGCKDPHGYNLPLFNASQYNPVFVRLLSFFKRQDMPLAQLMHTNFSNFAYFSFSALGCPTYEEAVKDKDGDPVLDSEGNPVIKSYPKSQPDARRIEEPMLWLFHKMGYIGTDVPLDNPDEHIPCPFCGSLNTVLIPPDNRVFITKRGLFSKKKEIHNMYCNACEHHWFDEQADMTGGV